MSFLRVDKDLCTGCRICETACSIAKERVINRAKSRIHIYRSNILELVDRVCIQCPEPVCLSACPQGAIYKKGNSVRVEETKCTGCAECIKVCDRLFLSPEGDKVLMCDQCGACVLKCPENALKIE